MDKLRIILAEDHQTVREGIKLLVHAQPDMEVIGEANNGEAVIKLAQEHLPDLILMDISMPDLNGLKATKRIREFSRKIKILVLTRHTEDGYVRQMMRAGASGYVLKQSAPSELINAIRAVAAGKSYLDPTITENVVGNLTGDFPGLRGARTSSLSPRELEVLRQIAWGYSNKEIASKLELSIKTIEAHKANAMKKLNMVSRIDIVRFAILQGWLQEN